MAKKILVINMGMKSIRSIVFDVDGNKLASASLPLTTALHDEQVTQNPEEWWDKAREVIKETLRVIKAEDIAYITATTSAACLLGVNHKLHNLTPCIMVSDRRAKEESTQIMKLHSFQEIRKMTGLQMDPHMLLPKILWIKKHEPKIYERTYKFLTPNDYLIAKLTGGRIVTDYINAVKWHYDSEGDTYPRNVMADIGFDSKKLPEVVSPGYCAGHVSEDAAKQLGLSEHTKVIVSTYDAICSFIGSGAIHIGDACDITGTVTVLRTIAENESVECKNGVQFQHFKELGLNILGGSNNMGGGLIEWVKQCYYENDSLPYERMEKEAAEAGLGAGGLIFLPYLLGERMPVWDSDARGVFFGLERTHTRKEMTRAVFESTGFIDLDMISAIEESGGEVRRIYLSGGLSRIPLISQIKADITGREIYVLDEFETTASGAAMIALLGQGEINSLEAAVDSFARIRMIIKPNRKAHEKYQALYRLYKETYASLKKLFPKRLEIVDAVIGEKEIRIENL